MKVFFLILFSPIWLLATDIDELEAGFCPQCIANSFKNKNLEKLPVTNCDILGDEKALDIVRTTDKHSKSTKLTNPSNRTSTSVTYKFPEITLKPGEAIYFGIPKDLQKKSVNFVVLGHRQDASEETGFDPKKNWDSVPGLTSFQVLTTNEKGVDEWRFWAGQSSGEKGAKFAEVRSDLEMENLYEWNEVGTGSVKTDEMTSKPVLPKVMKVVNVGKDLVRVGEVTLKSQPDQFDSAIEAIFSPGTKFNSQAAKKAKFGGGQEFEGKFPNAIELNTHRKNKLESLPKGWEILDNNILSIPLPTNTEVSSIEIAGGDSHPDGVKNKDGGTGTPGWSKLSIGIGSSKESADWLLKNENVPPEGLMLGSPTDCGKKTKSGEKLFIKATGDTLYIMGVRIGLKK